MQYPWDTVSGIYERYLERKKSKNYGDNTMSPASARRGCRYVPTWGTELENTSGLSIKESIGEGNRVRIPGTSAKRIEEDGKDERGE